MNKSQKQRQRKYLEEAPPEFRKALERALPSVFRFTENLSRAYNLVNIYKSFYGKGKGKKKVHKVDILRAAVVLTHASLEDFLRSLAAQHLPNADEEALNLIPLKGLSNSGRAEKFFLGKLVGHRGKSVDSLIEESVAQYLERSNFNNTQEIAALLSSIGINVSEVNSTFAEIDQMMRRRHQIVHRADRVEVKGRGTTSVQSLGSKEVEKWIRATQKFMTDVVTEIGSKELSFTHAEA